MLDIWSTSDIPMVFHRTVCRAWILLSSNRDHAVPLDEPSFQHHVFHGPQSLEKESNSSPSGCWPDFFWIDFLPLLNHLLKIRSASGSWWKSLICQAQFRDAIFWFMFRWFLCFSISFKKLSCCCWNVISLYSICFMKFPCYFSRTFSSLSVFEDTFCIIF